jgi:outer membrane protein TolC
MIMRKLFGALILTMACLWTSAQPDSVSSATLPASTLQLTYTQFLGLVLENHPVAQQAALQGQTGAQYLRAARGAFDPYLAASWDAKQFSGKNYWQVLESSLRVPTWWGTELYAGFNSATGDYLDQSQYLPKNGQAAIGLQVNLGRGLLIDQRRADLKKAAIYAKATVVEQRLMLLDLIQDATYVYWNWWLAYANKATYLEALDLASVRFEAVRSSFERGENPAIDTLEAYLQVQNRQLNLNEAEVDLVKTSRLLNNYLWNPNGEPVEFQIELKPQGGMDATASSLPTIPDVVLDSLIQAHPDLLYYGYQVDQLKIEERWRKEQLKPEMAIKYQALTAAPAGSELLGALAPASNLKWGVKFSFPLFLRKQRSYLELTRIELQQVSLKQEQKEVEIKNKNAAIAQQLDATARQVGLYDEMVTNYRRLVDAEMERFQLGESSIFLINSREQKLIEAELKLNELKAKVPKLLGDANRATGGYLIGD